MNRMQAMVGRLGAVGVVAVALHAPPAAAFFDDFEDGDAAGWLESTTGGSGSTGVETHNGSKMAFVRHVGNGSHSLSHDFAYGSAQPLSFDMHAVAVISPFGNHASSGVTLSFFNQFNVALGTAGFYNTSNPASLGAHEQLVDLSQHTYSGTMGDFATLAGLNPATSIAKISLRFDALASNSNIVGSASSASVWFDNVVAGVPEPQTFAAMLSGLALIALFVSRRRADGDRREAAAPG